MDLLSTPTPEVAFIMACLIVTTILFTVYVKLKTYQVKQKMLLAMQSLFGDTDG